MSRNTVPMNPNYDYKQESDAEGFSDNSYKPEGVAMHDWDSLRLGMIESYDISMSGVSDQLGREKVKRTHKRLGDYGGGGKTSSGKV